MAPRTQSSSAPRETALPQRDLGRRADARHALESAIDIARNRRSTSPGIGDRHRPESVIDIARNTHLSGQDAQMVRAAYLAMNVTAWFVIVPLAFAASLTGLVQSLGTRWGLFRHYWVLAKLLLTVIATIVLLLKLKLIGYIAGVAGTTLSIADLREARIELAVHAGGGLLVLLVVTTLSVYKPWGRTRYGLIRSPS
jgi:hypothetical protein